MTRPRPINLALQGGGSHGAFTWGVLDTLLTIDELELEAISGTSAGAVNAVVLAQGLAQGSRSAARASLRRFWDGVVAAGRLFPQTAAPFDGMWQLWGLDRSPLQIWADVVSRVASPYDLNLSNYNPLRTLLNDLVDFEAVRRCATLKVFVTATNVETGRPQVFRHDTLTVEHVLASACLPHVSQAVIIDGVPYWDGGYLGNPTFWPLFEFARTEDCVLVQINPLRRSGVPTRSFEINDRLNEITFNSSMMSELRAIDFVNQLIDEGRLAGTGYRRARLHHIADEEMLGGLGASSKFNVERGFIDQLFAAGRGAARRWWLEHCDEVGVRATLDVGRLIAGEDGLDGDKIRRAALVDRIGPTQDVSELARG